MVNPEMNLVLADFFLRKKTATKSSSSVPVSHASLKMHACNLNSHRTNMHFGTSSEPNRHVLGLQSSIFIGPTLGDGNPPVYKSRYKL